MRRVLNLPLLHLHLDLPFASPEKKSAFLAAIARLKPRRPQSDRNVTLHPASPETSQGYSEFAARRYQSRLR